MQSLVSVKITQEDMQQNYVSEVRKLTEGTLTRISIEESETLYQHLNQHIHKTTLRTYQKQGEINIQP